MPRSRIPMFVLAFLCAGSAQLMAQSSTLTGTSRAMNPAISVNGLFRGEVSREDYPGNLDGFRIDGVEVQFSSIVDPFWRADVLIGIHPEDVHEEDEADGGHGSHMAVDIEEAYIDGQSLPAGLGLRVGKFALPFGKHAPLHMHQYPFADAPAVIYTFLGDHLLTDTGLMAGITVPLPWFSDIRAYGVGGQSTPFDSDSEDLAFGGRWINLWDLSEDSTLEAAGSFLTGTDARHPGENMRADFFGADLTWRWISSRRSQGPEVRVTLEAVWPDYEEGEGTPWGWYGYAQYRFHRNWWVGAALGLTDGVLGHEEEDHEHEGHDHGPEGDVREYKINLTFAPSEFSSLRAGLAYYQDPVTKQDDLRFIFQANFTIGSHPAHLY